MTMLKVCLAAALAGFTGFVAKHFLTSTGENSPTQPPQKIEFENATDDIDDPSKSVVNVRLLDTVSESPLVNNVVERCLPFRFPSTGHEKGERIRCGGSNKGVSVSDKLDGEPGCSDVQFKQRKTGKRFYLCLNRRKTNKNRAGSSKGSSFGRGLGVGITYMLMARKSEISRLNKVMDETATVLEELKRELNKGKLSRNLQNLDAAENVELDSNKKTECGSNTLNLTEEPDQGNTEMDLLEAEFEAELQKLPWYSMDMEDPSNEILNTNLQMDASSQRFSDSDQCHGVSASELNQKLCQLLIERQESQIVELESELNLTQSKLHEKESELQALKDYVRRLTEFSLCTVSDGENDS